ncbi:MAG: glycerate kinase [Bacteroidetes bacterium]|nr:glycerate kinase [Bacteroidota bacterium]
MLLSPEKNIFISPTAFKESLSARGLSEFIQSYLFNRGFRNLSYFPGSDGGNSFLEALSAGYEGKFVKIQIPLIAARTTVDENIFLFNDEKTAAIETASVIGLERVPLAKRHPLQLNSKPLGIAIRKIQSLFPSVSKVWIGLGGTATIDLGAGLLEGLGFQFLDESGKQISAIPSNFDQISSVVPSSEPVPELHFYYDVKVPIRSESGSFIRVYGPQKGLEPKEVTVLEKSSARLINLFGLNSLLTGAGGALALFPEKVLKTKFLPGTKEISALHSFKTQFEKADIIITGEGRLDSQSFQGKWVTAFLDSEKPVLCLCGQVESGLKLPQNWIVASISELESDPEKSKQQVKSHLRTLLDRYIV